jgi:hypothetical protein
MAKDYTTQNLSREAKSNPYALSVVAYVARVALVAYVASVTDVTSVTDDAGGVASQRLEKLLGSAE